MATASQTSSSSSSMMVPSILSCLTRLSQNILLLNMSSLFHASMTLNDTTSPRELLPNLAFFQLASFKPPVKICLLLKAFPVSPDKLRCFFYAQQYTVSTSLVRQLFYCIVLIRMFVFQLENSFLKVEHIFYLCISSARGNLGPKQVFHD